MRRLALILSMLFYLILFTGYAFGQNHLKTQLHIDVPFEFVLEFGEYKNLTELNIIWELNPMLKTNEIRVADLNGNIVYLKKCVLRDEEEITDINILRKGGTSSLDLVFLEGYLIKDPTNPNALSKNRELQRVANFLDLDKLIPHADQNLSTNYSLLLDLTKIALGTKKYIAPRYIKLVDLDISKINYLHLAESGFLHGDLYHYRKCHLAAPVLRDYSDPEEDQHMFWFMYNDIYSQTAPKKDEYYAYAEMLKQVLFSFNLDFLISSGRYSGQDLEGLKRCRDCDGVITDLDIVIMWTAFRTYDINYIAKTYDELIDYCQKKPSYLSFLYHTEAACSYPFPVSSPNVGDLIIQLKSHRGGK